MEPKCLCEPRACTCWKSSAPGSGPSARPCPCGCAEAARALPSPCLTATGSLLQQKVSQRKDARAPLGFHLPAVQPTAGTRGTPQPLGADGVCHPGAVGAELAVLSCPPSCGCPPHGVLPVCSMGTHSKRRLPPPLGAGRGCRMETGTGAMQTRIPAPHYPTSKPASSPRSPRQPQQGHAPKFMPSLPLLPHTVLKSLPGVVRELSTPGTHKARSPFY